MYNWLQLFHGYWNKLMKSQMFKKNGKSYGMSKTIVKFTVFSKHWLRVTVGAFLHATGSHTISSSFVFASKCVFSHDMHWQYDLVAVLSAHRDFSLL